jgi:hypothetical protein
MDHLSIRTHHSLWRRVYFESVKPGGIGPDQRPTFALGVAVAVLTTPLWFLIVGWGTNLTNDPFLIACSALSGAVTILGCLLIIPWHWRRFGVGLAVGAPIAWLLEMLIAGLLLANATY